MNKVYRHIPLSPDEYLGHVEQDGKVFESKVGPDRYIGRVALESGQIYESRLGPDKQVARVDLNSGKVYQSRLGPDEYIGRVRKNGHCYAHRSHARDVYMGKIREMTSFAHAGAGFYLLLLPIFLDNQQKAADNVVNQNTVSIPNQSVSSNKSG
jgi:hypothetical protein